MALQDFIKKERLDRLVRDLEKIGHVRRTELCSWLGLIVT